MCTTKLWSTVTPPSIPSIPQRTSTMGRTKRLPGGIGATGSALARFFHPSAKVREKWADHAKRRLGGCSSLAKAPTASTEKINFHTNAASLRSMIAPHSSCAATTSKLRSQVQPLLTTSRKMSQHRILPPLTIPVHCVKQQKTYKTMSQMSAEVPRPRMLLLSGSKA